MPSPVDRLHDDFLLLIAHLDGELSLRSTADDSFRKSLLLASASYFEFQLSQCVRQFASDSSNDSSLIAGLVNRKVIERQYHSWFDWKTNNANLFYKMFGNEFFQFMKEKHAVERWLDASVNSFMELGRARNLLVHENFAAFTLEKTASEIFSAYENAAKFVEAIPEYLHQCNHVQKAMNTPPTAPALMDKTLQDLRVQTFCK